MIKRIIPLEEVKLNNQDDADLAVIFNHEIIEDDRGTWRWKPNSLTVYLADNAPILLSKNVEDIPNHIHFTLHDMGITARGRIDLNTLQFDLIRGLFTVEEKMKFSMQTGYSLCGFTELFGQHEASEFNLTDARTVHAGGQDKDDYAEVIEYMLRVHKGTILKL